MLLLNVCNEAMARPTSLLQGTLDVLALRIFKNNPPRATAWHWR